MTSPRRSSRDALAWALSESLRPTRSYEGLCLRFVRECFGIPPLFGTAAAAWEGTAPGDRSRTLPPPGKPVFWAVGSHGHVALSCGFGLCWSSDITRRGRINVVPLAVVEARWGARFLGWSESLNGVDLRPR